MSCALRPSLFVLLVMACLRSTSQAAPPDLKYLYPAGVQQGQTVEVSATGSFPDWPLTSWVSSPDVQVTAAKDKGMLTVTASPGTKPGLYWMRLIGGDGASPPCPFIVGGLPEVAEQEPNDHFRKPQRLDSTALVVNGRLRGRRGEEVDTFAMTLNQGQTLVAALEANTMLASPVDAIMQIVSSDGFVLQENEDARGLDPQVVFEAPSDGDYLVRLFGFPATPTSRIDFAGDDAFVYRLTLTTAGWVDYAIPLAVERGVSAMVEPHGWNLRADAKTLSVGPLEETISAGALHPHLASAATLLVESQPVSVEHEPNDRAKPETIALPQSITGRIDPPRDQDVYSFHAKQDQTLQFKVLSRTLGYPLDAVLELLDAEGKSLARADDAGSDRDAELTHRMRADGEVRLVVSDLHRGGGDRFVYLLRAAVAQPDFTLTVENHAFTVAANKPLEIPIKIERKLDFAGEIELQLLNPPHGVTAAAVKSLPKEGSAKSVKLVVTATADAASGPIRVVGRAMGDAPVTRFGEATLRGRSQRIADLWLSVTPASP